MSATLSVVLCDHKDCISSLCDVRLVTARYSFWCSGQNLKPLMWSSNASEKLVSFQQKHDGVLQQRLTNLISKQTWMQTLGHFDSWDDKALCWASQSVTSVYAPSGVPFLLNPPPHLSHSSHIPSAVWIPHRQLAPWKKRRVSPLMCGGFQLCDMFFFFVFFFRFWLVWVGTHATTIANHPRTVSTDICGAWIRFPAAATERENNIMSPLIHEKPILLEYAAIPRYEYLICVCEFGFLAVTTL